MTCLMARRSHRTPGNSGSSEGAFQVQTDLHHAGTYVVARLAGFTHNDAATIGHAAQMVDDSNNKGTITFDNGKMYEGIASAHTNFDARHNCVNSEDYEVWVPFHFLPGNNGAVAKDAGVQDVPLYRRLVCTPDSPITVDMWRECGAKRADATALHRLGITAHVYCDTFVHQMFAGFRHHVNRVTHIEHTQPADTGVMDRIKSLVADELDLGHGGALTGPDLPYLVWRYINGYGQDRTVSNPELYMAAMPRLFSQFIYYLGRDKNTAMSAADLAAMEKLIRTTVDVDPIRRDQVWLAAIRDGAFSFGKVTDEEFAGLKYVPFGEGSWRFVALGSREDRDKADHVFHYDEKFEESDWKKFHDALRDHQRMVLEGILPEYQLPRSYDDAKARGL
jgi:hypothetical protein